jgi:hypothetical protein
MDEPVAHAEYLSNRSFINFGEGMVVPPVIYGPLMHWDAPTQGPALRRRETDARHRTQGSPAPTSRAEEVGAMEVVERIVTPPSSPPNYSPHTHSNHTSTTPSSLPSLSTIFFPLPIPTTAPPPPSRPNFLCAEKLSEEVRYDNFHDPHRGDLNVNLRSNIVMDRTGSIDDKEIARKAQEGCIGKFEAGGENKGDVE